MHLHAHQVPVFDAGALERVVVDAESERLDQCSGLDVAAHVRATAPVFGGISGSTSTMRNGSASGWQRSFGVLGTSAI